jgi:hypothetical protein
VALTAMGTLLLAAATTVAILVTLHTTKTDRERDDLKRQEDRNHEADLRRQDAAEWDRRTNTERRDREDYEARQVTIEVTATQPPVGTFHPGSNFNHRITVRSPAVFPIKWLEMQIAHQAGTSVALYSPRHGGDPAVLENGFTVYRYWAEIPEQARDAAPIIRFVDRHGNLYYQYKGHTQRFPQNTDFGTAATAISNWLNTGPKPDQSPGQ